MNIIDIIQKDLPNFTGICVREGEAKIEKVREYKISLAWKMNEHRAKNYKKIIIVGNNHNKGKYFVADIISILSIKEAYSDGSRKEGIDYQEEIYGKWITERINGTVKDNALEERFAILFDNPKEIKKFSTDFSFSRTSIYYIDRINQPAINTGERIEINNFGKIDTARIKINGLTLIAGVNDTGKSTAGKILFSIIKATSRYKQDLKEDKLLICLNLIERLYNYLRRSDSRSFEFDTLKREFFPKTFLNQIVLIQKSNEQFSLFGESNDSDYTDIDAFFKFKSELINNSFPNKELKKINDLLLEIKDAVLSEENKQEQITRALGRALFSEFLTDITPKGTLKKTEIKYFAGNTNLLDVELKDNKITKLNFTDDLSFKDVVFIETPLLIQMYDLVKNSDTMFEEEDSSLNFRPRSKVSLHIKDLIDKIDNAKYYSDSLYENDFDSIEILDKISNVINGGYTFDKENKDLIFINTNDKKKSYQIKAVNTASGIKSFGIIQLLLQGSILNDRSLLIIDEPENHLHPEWQVKYAEMIVELVKNDIPVIITSHSPYMIQALKYFSEKNNVTEKANYYYADMNEAATQSNLIDVTNNLNIIFSKLAEPLKDLVWS